MGSCRYCGKSAGVLSTVHQACVVAHNQASTKIPQLVASWTGDAATLVRVVRDAGRVGLLNPSELNAAISEGLNNMIDAGTMAGPLSEVDTAKVIDIRKAFGNDCHADQSGPLQRKLVQSTILRELNAGKQPSLVQADGSMGIFIGPNEVTIWIAAAALLETKTHSTFVGGTNGLSVRLMKGVYYHVGSFKGQSVKYDVTETTDSGWLVFTDKTIYFKGSKRAFTLKYPKILGLDADSTSITVHMDGRSLKPFTFGILDVAFISNLLNSIMERQAVAA